MNVQKIVFSALLLGSLASCTKVEDKFDELLINPNNPQPEAANVDLFLNRVQLGVSSVFNTASSVGGKLTRQEVFYGPLYNNGYNPQSFNGVWSTAYTSVLQNANNMITLAQSQNRLIHVGIGKILKAYTLATLVDMFGDVPYSEANLGAANTNPKADQGSAVYAACMGLLDEAIADIGSSVSSTPAPSNDLFYGGNKTRWVTAAKTLKLKLLITTRLVDAGAKDKINALLAANDLIDTNAEDFTFKYGTKQDAPNSRHPRFNTYYTATGAGDYIGTYFMWSMTQEKALGTFGDPRTRYYFYRQKTNLGGVSEDNLPCAGIAPPAHYVTSDAPYCWLSGGFWGRDHGDDSGIPPDGTMRTAYGIYPAGGKFDANQNVRVNINDGAQGMGIAPIWMSSFTDFVKAEAALVLGTTGDPRALLESGVKKSIATVLAYPASIGQSISSDFIPTQATIDAYVNRVLEIYDNASTTKERLEVIIKEYYLASWGNGLEPYNSYRRTSLPSNLQPTLQTSPGVYMRSFWLPADYVNLNLNADQKADVGVKVFWDTNPDNLK
ncbi:SusD/RagB family nutrient-binding outer membrane lipoprotein [Flavihumibacter stibioxidans]|uniref:SusD/RagB family nutrient-binding outer membrane lipoprotein n=1 Tax=Flavihumibacter stibioxidans TaxID=1834163 RepID=A0ABR7M9E9_9BACT|nr:SusD/RagB family nutrient-binding outer membrane lipoprotein [Flavihumibacter stibioxidans]MBC6491655.1 hypothetical protein [Flavihumibacter stibioxidans]